MFHLLVIQYWLGVCFFGCFPLIVYQKGARNHCKSNEAQGSFLNTLFKYREVTIWRRGLVVITAA